MDQPLQSSIQRMQLVYSVEITLHPPEKFSKDHPAKDFRKFSENDLAIYFNTFLQFL